MKVYAFGNIWAIGSIFRILFSEKFIFLTSVIYIPKLKQLSSKFYLTSFNDIFRASSVSFSI